MRRQTRTNLFLLAMVALLGAGVFAEFRRERAMTRDPLTTLDPETIRTIRVSCLSCTTRRYEKTGAHWFMREPDQKPANDAAIDRLAMIVRAPVRYRRPASELDTAKLGLDPPVATLEADGAVLKFGTTDAIRNDRYVGYGDTIALVPDRFSVLLFATPESEVATPARK